MSEGGGGGVRVIMDMTATVKPNVSATLFLSVF